jgi:hypothetical protein
MWFEVGFEFMRIEVKQVTLFVKLWAGLFFYGNVGCYILRRIMRSLHC